jgi:hypothetical protein
MLKNVLDDLLLKSSGCHRRDCPTDDELKQYPMLDEDHFDLIDERLYYCQTCKNRLDQIEKGTGKISNS